MKHEVERMTWPMGAYKPFARDSRLSRKTEKVERYAERELRTFQQIDCYYTPGEDDVIIRADSDGDCVTAGFTSELMNASDVRILIGTRDHATAVRLLRKAVAWLERDPGLLGDELEIQFLNDELGKLIFRMDE